MLAPGQDRKALERAATLLGQATALNPNADGAWGYLAEVLAALGRADEALAAAEKAIALVPTSSRHRVSLARVYLRLERYPEGLKAAGLGRAVARTQAERDDAQRALADLARASAPPQAAEVPESVAPEPAAATGPTASGMTTTIALKPASGGSDAAGRDVGSLINDCYDDNATCARALPVIVADCRAATTITSTPACREAGYIHDAGVGVPARPALAADFYLLACNRRDELSCVRLATLRSLGRGVPRDALAAVAVLEPACADGRQEACYRLGLHLSATGVAADRARAREVLTASCAADFPESCAALKKLPQR